MLAAGDSVWNCHFSLGHEVNVSAEYAVEPSIYRGGSSGIGSLTRIQKVTYQPRYVDQQGCEL